MAPTLMSLPAEIRLRIFEFVLPERIRVSKYYTEQAHSLLKSEPVCHTWVAGLSPRLLEANMYEISAEDDDEEPSCLLRLSKQIYAEVKSLLSSRIILDRNPCHPDPYQRWCSPGYLAPALIQLPDGNLVRHLEVDIFCPFEINIGYELPRLQSLSLRLNDGIDDTGVAFFRSHICEVYLSRRLAKQSLNLAGCLGDFCQSLPAMCEGGLITQVSELMTNCQVAFQLPIHSNSLYLRQWEHIEAQTWAEYSCNDDTIETHISNVELFEQQKPYSDEVERQLLDEGCSTWYVRHFALMILDMLVVKELMKCDQQLLISATFVRDSWESHKRKMASACDYTGYHLMRLEARPPYPWRPSGPVRHAEYEKRKRKYLAGPKPLWDGLLPQDD